MQARVISIKSVGVSHSYPALFSWAPDSTNQQTWSLSNAPSFFFDFLRRRQTVETFMVNPSSLNSAIVVDCSLKAKSIKESNEWLHYLCDCNLHNWQVHEWVHNYLLRMAAHHSSTELWKLVFSCYFSWLIKTRQPILQVNKFLILLLCSYPVSNTVMKKFFKCKR